MFRTKFSAATSPSTTMTARSASVKSLCRLYLSKVVGDSTIVEGGLLLFTELPRASLSGNLVNKAKRVYASTVPNL